jgi:hypothetical protein
MGDTLSPSKLSLSQRHLRACPRETPKARPRRCQPSLPRRARPEQRLSPSPPRGPKRRPNQHHAEGCTAPSSSEQAQVAFLLQGMGQGPTETAQPHGVQQRAGPAHLGEGILSFAKAQALEPVPS